MALDNHMDVLQQFCWNLSKAFYCLPRWLLIAKLKIYQLSEEALNSWTVTSVAGISKLDWDYTRKSSWEKLFKGVLQGSILGSLVFNVL